MLKKANVTDSITLPSRLIILSHASFLSGWLLVEAEVIVGQNVRWAKILVYLTISVSSQVVCCLLEEIIKRKQNESNENGIAHILLLP